MSNGILGNISWAENWRARGLNRAPSLLRRAESATRAPLFSPHPRRFLRRFSSSNSGFLVASLRRSEARFRGSNGRNLLLLVILIILSFIILDFHGGLVFNLELRSGWFLFSPGAAAPSIRLDLASMWWRWTSGMVIRRWRVLNYPQSVAMADGASSSIFFIAI